LVEAEYDNNTAIAKCVALRDTHFRILLFHGESEKDIVVVIEKISGCNMIFEEEYIAIMNAARYGEIMPRETPKSFNKSNLEEESKNSDDIPFEHNILGKTLMSEKSCVPSDRRDIHVIAIGDCTDQSILDERTNNIDDIPLEHDILEESIVSEKGCVPSDRRDIHIMAIGESLPTNPAHVS